MNTLYKITQVIAVIFWFSLVGFAGYEIYKKANPNAGYKPTDFRINYGIDLKPEGYLIRDAYDDEVYYVEFGELENWFLEINM